MNISVDISYYPLKKEYLNPIQDFIDRLKARKSIEVRVNGMSTQVFGTYDEVMKALSEEIKRSFEVPDSVFVLKVVNDDLRKHDPK
ncbi:MAG: hypothetical protein K9I94_02290 [Bacteroidales bacterium]|nr:hypothetical protein [Bacteroidales bacterium]